MFVAWLLGFIYAGRRLLLHSCEVGPAGGASGHQNGATGDGAKSPAVAKRQKKKQAKKRKRMLSDAVQVGRSPPRLHRNHCFAPPLPTTSNSHTTDTKPTSQHHTVPPCPHHNTTLCHHAGGVAVDLRVRFLRSATTSFCPDGSLAAGAGAAAAQPTAFSAA